MGALDRKLFRDIWNLKGQVLAIALVLAAGIATYVMSAATLDTMRRTQTRMYREFRFPDLFSGMKRAPRSVLERVAAIPGVSAAEGRVVAPAIVELAGFHQPITGQIVSLPESPPLFNLLHLRTGRLPEVGREQEAVVSDGFAAAHKLPLGTILGATINGRKRKLVVVGVVSTPEYIYQLAPGSIVPDFTTYCVLWMNRAPLEGAFNMTGAINQVVAGLGPGTRVEDAVDALDNIVRQYGGLGAYGRRDQLSHRYLTEEFKQLEQMATIFPAMFLSVAAFLLNVVVGRLMATQRAQIATLKAFGYTTAEMAVHYLKLASLIVFVGLLIGLAGGVWMGRGLSNLYKDVYRFPYLDFTLQWRVVMVSALVCLVAAGAGTLFAVLRAAGESPAVAMQPASPGTYRLSLLERLGGGRWLSQGTRIIFRNMERRPVKSVLSVIGVAMSTAILVLGGFWGDAIDYMVFAQLRRAQLDDLTVTFIGPVSMRAMGSIASLPGVTLVEPTRTAPARLRFAQRSYRTSIQGFIPNGILRRLLDKQLRPVAIPPDGILLTDHLAKMLAVHTGDRLTVELLDGSRAVREIPVAGEVSEYIGVSAYMDMDALNRFLREGDSATGVYLAADMRQQREIYARLQAMTAVAGTTARSQVLTAFYETLAKQMLTFSFFITLLAATIAIGVVYNTIRIGLSERSRELASLRVLGYTQGEVAYILLGELALLVALAIPLGLVLGKALSGIMSASSQTELFRVPQIVEPSTYAFASLVVLLAALASAVVVSQMIRQLDLVEVLKARE